MLLFLVFYFYSFHKNKSFYKVQQTDHKKTKNKFFASTLIVFPDGIEINVKRLEHVFIFF